MVTTTHPYLADQYAEWSATDAGETVIAEFVHRARRLRMNGIEHFGAQAIIEAIRFDRAVRITPGADGFRINNDYAAFIAREVMAKYPDLRGFFETRRSKADAA